MRDPKRCGSLPLEDDRPEPCDRDERARAALAYLLASPAGKRSSALGALWMVMLGVGREAPGPYGRHIADTLRAVRSPTRQRVRVGLDAAIAVEVDPACRGGMVRLLRYLHEFELVVVGRA